MQERTLTEAILRGVAELSCMQQPYQVLTEEQVTQLLERGHIVESGRHEDLVRAGGRYSALVSRDARLATPGPDGDDVPALAQAS